MSSAAPMRIVVVHPSDELYGADRVLLEVTEVLEARGQVRVLLPTDVDYPDHLLSAELAARGTRCEAVGLPVLRREYLRATALPGLAVRAWRTGRLLRRLRPDVVYLSTSASLLVAPLARLSGARVVLHVHETWTGSERRLLGAFLRACDGVVAVSDAVAAELPGPRGRVTVVHNGFTVPAADAAAAEALRAGLGVGPGDLVALVASRWNAWKGHDVLLRAWADLTRRDLHLVVLGAPPPSGASIDVDALVAALPDPSRVHVLGARDDVPAWIAASDVVLVPSTRPDPLPTIAIEAAALGRAVLASDAGGLPDIVDDGRTGTLVPAGDVASWRAALEGLDGSVLTAQGRRAVHRFETSFTRSAFALRFARAFDAAVGLAPALHENEGAR